MAAGVDYCGLVKTSHKGFYLATLENFMRDFPGGSYFVMKITPSVPGGRPLLYIGYKNNPTNDLGFIATEWAGITETGYLYLSCFPYIYSNVSVHPVGCPHLLDSYFVACNAIYNYNKM